MTNHVEERAIQAVDAITNFVSTHLAEDKKVYVAWSTTNRIKRGDDLSPVQESGIPHQHGGKRGLFVVSTHPDKMTRYL